VDLYDAATIHSLSLEAQGRSPATIRLYKLYEQRFLEYLHDRGLPADLDQLSSLHVRQAVLWFQQRRVGKRGGQVATAAFLNTLKTWSNFLEHEEILPDSPLRRVRRVKIRKLERQPFTRAEINAMLHAADQSIMPERDRLLVLLLLESGARISEITGLHLADLRFPTRTVRVLGKGNRERTIPIGAPEQPDGGPVWRAYRAYLKVREHVAQRVPERAGDRLFLTQPGYPLTGPGGTAAIKRLGAAGGVDDALAHRLRHTAATHYLTIYPGDEVGLRRLLGHISNATMVDYVHLSQNIIAERAGRASLSASFLKEGRR
jgi:site-specific recombinase XerD